MVVFGPGCSILAQWLYSGKSSCVLTKVSVFGLSWLFSLKVVLCGQQGFFFGKSGCIGAKWFY